MFKDVCHHGILKSDNFYRWQLCMSGQPARAPVYPINRANLEGSRFQLGVAGESRLTPLTRLSVIQSDVVARITPPKIASSYQCCWIQRLVASSHLVLVVASPSPTNPCRQVVLGEPFPSTTSSRSSFPGIVIQRSSGLAPPSSFILPPTRTLFKLLQRHKAKLRTNETKLATNECCQYL